MRVNGRSKRPCVWFVRMWVLSVALAAGAVCSAASSSPPKKTIHKGQEKRWQLVLLDSRYTQDIVFLVGYKRRPSRRPFTTIRFFFAVVSSSLQTNTYLQKHFVKKLFLASLVTKGHFCDSPLCNIESYFSFFSSFQVWSPTQFSFVCWLFTITDHSKKAC